MLKLRPWFVVVAFLPLVACPESGPDASQGGQPAGPGGPPPGGEPGAPGARGGPTADGQVPAGPPPGEGGAPPEGGPPATEGGAPVGASGQPTLEPGAPVPGADVASQPPPAADAPPPAQLKPPGFASLIGTGKSVKLTGTVTGLKSGQVDFTVVKKVDGHDAPECLDSVTFTDGKFEIAAPASYERPIYVTVMSAPGTDPLGGAAAPVKLEGKDVAVSIAVSQDSAWQKSLPWVDPNAPKPPDRSKPVPPGGPPK